MTVETEVAALTSAVNNLTASVNVAKGTLDAKVSDAQTAEANAASYETGALAAKNAAETAAASAVSVVEQDLSAISADMPAGAVAICEINPWNSPGDHLAWMHDASKSWYQEERITTKYLGAVANEAAARAVVGAQDGDWYWSSDGKCYVLNVGAGTTEKFRFGSQHFAARSAVANAANDRVILLDAEGIPFLVMIVTYKGYGQNNGASMIANVYGSGSTNNAITSLKFIGSTLLVGRTSEYNSVNYSCLNWINFAADQGGAIGKSAGNGLSTAHKSFICNGSIGQRNTLNLGARPYDKWQSGIVDNSVNDIAATVLPNAPADPDTGLPVPTIAVATEGGNSVIRDDGTVVNPFTSYATKRVAFLENYSLVFSYSGDHQIRQVVPPYDGGSTPSFLTSYGWLGMPSIAPTSSWTGVSEILPAGQRFIAQSSSAIHNPLATAWPNLNVGDADLGMVAYQAEDFATPPMFGDVKGAFLCERGAATLVGANYFSASGQSGVIDSGTTPWLSVTGLGQASIAADVITWAGPTSWEAVRRDFSVPSDTFVVVEISVNRTSGTLTAALNNGGTNIGKITASGTYFLTGYQSGAGLFQFGTSNFVGTAEIKNVWKATPDRSVNGKGAIINGTLTRDADGWVNGFNSSSYLEQPYNPDLDFGANDDFHIAGWVDTTDSWATIVDRSDGTNAGRYTVDIIDGDVRFRSQGSTKVIAPAGGADGPTFFSMRRVAGVAYLSVNGGSEIAASDTTDYSVADAIVRLGYSTHNDGNLNPGSIRRVTIGAGAPSPAQIRVMANWKGDVIEGTIHDLSYVAETKSLWVLTSTYLYEIGPDGAERSKQVNDISATTLAAFRDGYLVS